MHRKLYRVEEVAEVLNAVRTEVFDLIRAYYAVGTTVGESRLVPVSCG